MKKHYPPESPVSSPCRGCKWRRRLGYAASPVGRGSERLAHKDAVLLPGMEQRRSSSEVALPVVPPPSLRYSESGLDVATPPPPLYRQRTSAARKGKTSQAFRRASLTIVAAVRLQEPIKFYQQEEDVGRPSLERKGSSVVESADDPTFWSRQCEQPAFTGC